MANARGSEAWQRLELLLDGAAADLDQKRIYRDIRNFLAGRAVGLAGSGRTVTPEIFPNATAFSFRRVRGRSVSKALAVQCGVTAVIRNGGIG
jgi:hypothetical protein